MVFRGTRFAWWHSLGLVVIAAMLMVIPCGFRQASAQSTGWLSADDESYLTSSGITVYVPSYVPGPVNALAPELAANDGSYSVYFLSGSNFLYVTGVAGGSFPGGSEANLNTQLTVNASVMGYPAIRDIGIPEGSDTPIYDKVMWIADGVLYTVNGNGLDTDSLTLANSSVALAGAPAPTEVPPTEAPVVEPTTAPRTSDDSDSTDAADTPTPADDNDADADVTPAPANTDTTDDVESPTPTPVLTDGTDGPLFIPDSDGTDGLAPLYYPDDGTGGA